MKTDGSFDAGRRVRVRGGRYEGVVEGAGVSIEINVLWNDDPISVTAPNFIELEVVQTDPGVEGGYGDRAARVAATLSTGCR